ncbi:MAG TPA: hypothetical protein PK843_01735 [bacterium]|nr:hypothetical protein [bacterium]
MLPGPADSTSTLVEREQMIIEWFKVDKTVAYVALVVGLFIIIIAYFSGGRENRPKLIFSILSSVVIGVLTLPLFIKFGIWVGLFGYQWGEIVLMTIYILYIAALSCNAYEIVTVSAKEARPN